MSEEGPQALATAGRKLQHQQLLLQMSYFSDVMKHISHLLEFRSPVLKAQGPITEL